MTPRTLASRSGGRPRSCRPLPRSAAGGRERGDRARRADRPEPPDDPVGADAETEAVLALLLTAADANARAGELENALASLALVERFELGAARVHGSPRAGRRVLGDKADSTAAARIDPGLRGATAAISDLERRIGRIRELEMKTGGRMKRDLSRLDEGMEQLRALSRESGIWTRRGSNDREGAEP